MPYTTSAVIEKVGPAGTVGILIVVLLLVYSMFVRIVIVRFMYTGSGASNIVQLPV